eukprot:m.121508 g.121508  ORF g.121508 m.121508 type:complete len:58 (+) comp23282_c0_seq1:39-212(+)
MLFSRCFYQPKAKGHHFGGKTENSIFEENENRYFGIVGVVKSQANTPGLENYQKSLS